MTRYQYEIDVNKGSMNSRTQAIKYNSMAEKGWRLHTVFEQHGNTVSVFERVVEES